MGTLTHLDSRGRARMVDVGLKPATRREAVARGEVRMRPEVLRLILEGRVPKGDVLSVARIAGILAAKKTDELIPLCHPLSLDSVELDFEAKPDRIIVRSAARARGPTGVEMEALTAAMVACLAIYDMAKSLDREMVLGPVYLVAKRGGKSGPYLRR